MWLGRVMGEPPPFGLDASFGMAELGRELAAARVDWDLFFDTQSNADLSRVIDYANSQRVPLAIP